MTEPLPAPRLTRRGLLRHALLFGGALASGSLLAACQGVAPQPTVSGPTAARPVPTAGEVATAASPAAAPAGMGVAADWPRQPVTLIVPWAAGGETDVPMRAVAEVVGRELGQPIVVQNVAGGSGTVGTRQARAARPDGYTLLAIHEHVSVNQHTGLVDYGVRDFEPIALIVTSPAYLATEASNQWSSLKELIDDATQRPGQISWGMTPGSISQLFAYSFMQKTGTKLKVVGYESTAQRMAALLGRQVDLGQTALPATVEQLKASKLKVLGYAWDQRDPRTPDIPTMREQGVDLVWGESRGWVGPKGTPAPIVARVQAALQRAVASPELKQKIEDEQGSLITYRPGQQYLEWLVRTDDDIKKVIAETGLKAG